MYSCFLPDRLKAHPNKRLAEHLHSERPDVYQDDNHKPEMAVTLSEFEALCGFRAFPEIIWNLKFYPELRAMVSVDALRQARRAFLIFDATSNIYARHSTIAR